MPAKDERETLAQGVQLGVAWVTVALFLLFGGTWLQEPISNPVAALLFLWLFATMVWSAFGAIKVADKLAEVLGEPLGSLVLTLTIIGLEGMLIGIAILTSDSGATIGRDTLFDANMIIINFAGDWRSSWGGVDASLARLVRSRMHSVARHFCARRRGAWP